MNYLTAMANSPVYEFPYTGSQTYSTPLFNNDISALISNITPTIGDVSSFQPGSITLKCVPEINTTVAYKKPLVYEVPENVPMETILNHFGVNVNTLKRSGSVGNYYRCSSDPMEITIGSSSNCRRRLVCREVTDFEDGCYDKRPLDILLDSSKFESNQPQRSPVALHNLLSNVWGRAREASENIPRSSSEPNIPRQWETMKNNSLPPNNFNMNNVWQAIRSSTPPPNVTSANNAWQLMRNSSPPPNNPNINNVWQAMRNSPPTNPVVNNTWQATRNTYVPPTNPSINNAWTTMINATPPMTQQERNAVNNVWQSANLESAKKSNSLSKIFGSMRESSGSVIQPPPGTQYNAALGNVLNQANRATSPVMNNNPWNRMLLSPLPPSYPPQSSTSLAWNRMAQGAAMSPPPPQSFYPSQPTAGLAWNRMVQGSNMPPPSPPPQPFYPSQPANNLAWNRMVQGSNMPPPSPPPQAFYPSQPTAGLAWNRMVQGSNMPPPSPPPQPFYPSQPANNLAWNRMVQGSNMPPPSPPPQPFYPSQPTTGLAWNRMVQGSNMPPPSPPSPPPQPFYPSQPTTGLAWNRMVQGSNMPPPSPPSPPPQPFYPSQPTTGLGWNRMTQGAMLPANPSPVTSLHPIPNRVPAPSSFASVLSEAHRQNLPYVGAS